jgi:hypothetical protein
MKKLFTMIELSHRIEEPDYIGHYYTNDDYEGLFLQKVDKKGFVEIIPNMTFNNSMTRRQIINYIANEYPFARDTKFDFTNTDMEGAIL